jgi:hypothetical protein
VTADKDDARGHVELNTLYTACVTEIGGFKQQQMAVTNYAIAVDVGLVATKQLLGTAALWERTVLAILVLAAAAFAIVVLIKLRGSIEVRRRRLRAIRAKFTLAFREAWSQQKPTDILHWLFPAFVGGGAMVTFWLVVR